MTTPDLEAAARAISKVKWPGIEWDSIHPTHQAKMINEARACISAIREPSEAVMQEGWDRCMEAADGSNAFGHIIDAILAEIEEPHKELQSLETLADDRERDHNTFRLENDREWKAKVDYQKSRAETAEAKLAKAREALKPFAEAALAYDTGDGREIAWSHSFTIGSLRRARVVLAELEEPQ